MTFASPLFVEISYGRHPLIFGKSAVLRRNARTMMIGMKNN
jgi:hypothetical protein